MENGKENKTKEEMEKDELVMYYRIAILAESIFREMYITGYSHCVLRKISVLPG